MVPHPDPPRRITLPSVPQKPSRRDFPVMATAAPVVGAVIMWAVTGSPFALMFAFLNPVMTFGALVDSRRQARRGIRAESKRYQRELDSVLVRVAAAHHAERQELLAPVMQPRQLLTDPVRNPEWWRQSWDHPVSVCLGTGRVPSKLDVEPLPVGAPPEVEQAHAKVVAAASTLEDAPIMVDARDGIGIVGPDVPAHALGRAVVAQLAFRLSPAAFGIVAAEGPFSWVQRLPHPLAHHGADGTRVEFHPVEGPADAPSARAVCVVTNDANTLPRECRVLVRLDRTTGATVERNPAGRPVSGFRPWFMAEVQASALAERATTAAEADGLVTGSGELPDHVEFSALAAPVAQHGRLPATFAVGPGGDLVVDLVRDGPHAVIGGTTGSGKSELLVSWVLALAITCSPAEVNFLLVDFKGGSSFSAVSGLPHTVGLITDLDQLSARRALLSLQAELRLRERVLATADARSLEELSPGDRMPRLVILVDEFAVVASEFPELQAVFADLAARGRSLGIHLVLCTQRPAGVIRDSVLANCSLRLSLRVNNPADSAAVIGVPDAASLPVSPQGRCLISLSGAEAIEVQVALASAADADSVAALHRDTDHAVRRPWCEPLPSTLSLDAAMAGYEGNDIVFGLVDRPESQSQPAATYDPQRDGNLVVLGGSGSGKTGVLDALGEALRLRGMPAVRIPSDVEGAWDVIGRAASLERADHEGRFYLLDDVDAVLARLPAEYQLEFIELLTRLLREGPSAGIRLVLTAARATASIQSLVSLCGSRLVLRMPNRQEHVLAGGEAAHFESDLPPGAGSWRGHRVQVAAVETSVEDVDVLTRAPWQWDSGGFAVVSPGARRLSVDAGFGLELLDITAQTEYPGSLDIGAGAGGQALVGDVGDWQGNWSLFAAVRRTMPIVFAGCNAADLRSLAGTRQLPPPLGPRPGAGWMLAVDGVVSRVQLPEWLNSRRPGG